MYIYSDAFCNIEKHKLRKEYLDEVDLDRQKALYQYSKAVEHRQNKETVGFDNVKFLKEHKGGKFLPGNL